MEQETTGQAMHSDDAEARRQAAAMMGSARTARKTAAARLNVARATEARRGKPMSEEHKAKLRASYQARNRQEIADREDGTTEQAQESNRSGRPKQQGEEEAGQAS